jgi:hypothetical protein
MGRHLSDEELEDGSLLHPVLDIGLEHRQLVQVREQGSAARIHRRLGRWVPPGSAAGYQITNYPERFRPMKHED